MSSNPLFSVVIPVYNKENYVLDTIESVVNQRNIDKEFYEIILVNDGSTDSSREIIIDFIERNNNSHLNVLLFSTPNQGVSNARNFGVSKSRGTYVCFLDSDDLIGDFYLATLKTQIDYIDNIYFLAVNYTNCLSELIVEERDTIFEEKNYITDKLSLCSSSVCIKKEIFDNEFYLFDVSQTHAEDTDVWFRLSMDFNVFYSNEPLVYYNDSVPNSAINSVQVLNNSRLLKKDFLLCKHNSKVNDNILVERIDEIRFVYILSCIRRGEVKLTLKHLRGINSVSDFVSMLCKKISKKLCRKFR